MRKYASNIPGISILIPIYNQHVVDFISALSQQAKAAVLPIEIICIDDASEQIYQEQNKSLSQLADSYELLPVNAGRSKIRNLLASRAQYSSLLFLDCDGQLVSNTFLKNYLAYMQHPVVVGGRVYSHSAPTYNELLLHWCVGKAREEQNAAERNSNPYKSFMFNNILISRDIYDVLSLDESISTYGHEDTKFGNMLKAQHIPVLHIDNPVLHLSLDATEKFLQKTEFAIQNYYKLVLQGIGKDAQLYKAFKWLDMLYLKSLFLSCYDHLLQKAVLSNLRSTHPKLVLYDLFKLQLLLRVARNHRAK